MNRLILNTAVSIILLLATTGYTIFKHYCDDRLVSVSINSETVPCCDMEGGCCTTESKHFQLEDDYISTIIDFNFTDNIIIDLNLLNCAADNIKNPKNTDYKQILVTESPPPLKANALLSQYQTFLL